MEDRRVGSTGGIGEAGGSDLDAEAIALMKEVLREVREASEKLAAAAQSASEIIAGTGTIPTVSSERFDSASVVSSAPESIVVPAQPVDEAPELQPLQRNEPALWSTPFSTETYAASPVASVPQVDTVDGIPIVSRAVAFSEEESFPSASPSIGETLAAARLDAVEPSFEQSQPDIQTRAPIVPAPQVSPVAQGAAPTPMKPLIPAEIVEAACAAVPGALQIESPEPAVQVGPIPAQTPGQTVYFTTTISNIPPAAQYVAPPAVEAPPVAPTPAPPTSVPPTPAPSMPVSPAPTPVEPTPGSSWEPLVTELPEVDLTPITLLDSDLGSGEKTTDQGSGTGFGEPLPIPVLTIAADDQAPLESPRMTFPLDDAVDIDHAKDFDMVISESGEKIPWAPFMILMFAGAALTAFSSWTLLQTPQTLSVYEDSYFLGLMMTAAGLSVLALFVVLPVWLIARTEKSMRRGLFTRCLFRGALTATLVSLLWAASVVVVDLIRSGAISL